jgi:hypothetical protein
LRLQWARITEGCRKYKEKTQQGVANSKQLYLATTCNKCRKDM